TSVFAYPGFPTYTLEHNPYAYNLKKARHLLAQAGHPNGKGIPTIYIYTQTSAASQQSVLMGEAIAHELKTGLNLNTKIDPTNSTEYGLMSYGGTDTAIRPGYCVDTGVANWNSPIAWTIGGNQNALPESNGIFGSYAFRRHVGAWYVSTYDPRNVAAWGNPTNAKLGTTYASWKPLIAAAQKDVAYLNAWKAKQPAAYQTAMTTPGAPTNTQLLAKYEGSWKTAKTAAAKHAAWTSFWKWVGTYSNGGGGINLGLNGQVYLDQHEPKLLANMVRWEAELAVAVSATKAAHLAAEQANAMIQSGYAIPLNAAEGIFLEKPNVHGTQINPWSWQMFYQLQYLRLS
ncbi:MAG: hypothetical protein M0Z36_05065, partial [Thermaerobacter sp.]|nr:hypothetical protein [Thermaerobacter sp.]